MAKRSYGQYCALARALDVLGDRWVLLIVRELLTGPKRFKELLGALPGIGPNLLTTRLRELEGQGVLQRGALPPPAASAVYELTERGRSLDRVMLEMARWGSSLLGPWSGEEYFNPEWCVLALNVLFHPEQARGLHEEYEFTVNGVTFHARVTDGTLQSALGPARDPVVKVTADAPTFFSLARGLDPANSEAVDRLKVEGDPEALQRCLRIFRPGV